MSKTIPNLARVMSSDTVVNLTEKHIHVVLEEKHRRAWFYLWDYKYQQPVLPAILVINDYQVEYSGWQTTFRNSSTSITIAPIPGYQVHPSQPPFVPIPPAPLTSKPPIPQKPVPVISGVDVKYHFLTL